MGFKRIYRLVLEFSAEAPDEIPIDERWRGRDQEEKALHDQTVRALHAALLGTYRQSLRNFILVDIIGQAAGGLTWDAIAQHFPEIAEHDPDDAAIAPAIASLSAEQQLFLAEMKEEGSGGIATCDTWRRRIVRAAGMTAALKSLGR